MPQFKVGDTVHIKHVHSAKWAGTYEVTKVNPTTYRLSGPKSSSLKAPHEMVDAGPLPVPGAGAPVGSPLVEVPPVSIPLPYETHLENGTVVKFKITPRGQRPDTLWVVGGQTARGYRLYMLGGNLNAPGRYYTGVNSASLEVVYPGQQYTLQQIKDGTGFESDARFLALRTV